MEPTTKAEDLSLKQPSSSDKQPQVVAKQQPLLTIIHFNDVYDIQPKGGSKGVCNFKAKVDALRQQFPHALTLFSGDCMSPSTLTNIKEGWQMVHALNTLKIDCACFGNHEFDFNSQHTLKLTKKCNFPWLLGNMKYQLTDKLLGDGKPYLVKEHMGLKIGILGVAGPDWIGILHEQYDEILQYEDAYEFSNRTAKYLRQTLKCDLVIALTHMRNAADKQFPLLVQGVDLVLGGHDHVVMEEFINETLVIKSGTNFNNVGLIHLYAPQKPAKYKGKRVNLDCTIFKIVDTQNIDVELKLYVDNLMLEYQQYDEIVGYTAQPLQTRFVKIRKQQSNYGNFLADLSRLYYDCDICAINAGMVRNDVILGPGKLTFSKVSNIIDSPMVVKKVSGKQILQMLELSVSSYPNFSGQFLFISGMTFSFDYRLTPRVQQVTIGGNPLDIHRNSYTLCTTLFQTRGGDGFTMLKEGQVLVDEVRGTSMLQLLLKFFKASDTHQQYQSIKVLADEIPKYKSQDSNSAEQELPQFPVSHLILIHKVSVRMGRIKDLRDGFKLGPDGKKLTSIRPVIDGRIRCLSFA